MKTNKQIKTYLSKGMDSSILFCVSFQTMSFSSKLLFRNIASFKNVSWLLLSCSFNICVHSYTQHFFLCLRPLLWVIYLFSPIYVIATEFCFSVISVFSLASPRHFYQINYLEINHSLNLSICINQSNVINPLGSFPPLER